MTREDIIRLMRKAGVLTGRVPKHSPYVDDFSRFAALVAAAEQPKPEPVAVFDEQMGHPVLLLGSPMLKDKQPLYTAPPATHPGYVIGSHWLETAYSRICAGEAEADVLRDIGLVREEAFLTGVAHLKAENERLREQIRDCDGTIEALQAAVARAAKKVLTEK